MKLNTVNLLVGLVIAVSGVFYLGTYIVDKTQYAIEIRLGDAVDTVTDPGLEFKVPFITRIFYVENRIQDFDADPGSVFTKDKKEMIVDTYSKWRVEDPLKFYQTVRTVSGALARLDDIIYSQTREILGKHTLVEIVSGNRKEIRETISINSRKNAEKFGIEVIDVRIKRADLPQSNSLAVYGRMEASRHAVHDVSSRHVSAPRQGWSVLALPKAAHSRTLALMRTHTHTYTHAHACTLIRTHTHTQPGAAILRWNTVCHDTSLPNSLR